MKAVVRSNFAALGVILLMAIVSGDTLAQGKVKSLNQIIRSLAPIEYLPEHSGIPARRSIDLDIRFEIDKATLLPEAVAQLQELGKALQSPQLRDKSMEIAGHTDATGSDAHMSTPE